MVCLSAPRVSGSMYMERMASIQSFPEEFLHKFQYAEFPSWIRTPRLLIFANVPMQFIRKKSYMSSSTYFGFWKPLQKIKQPKNDGTIYDSAKMIRTFDSEYIPNQTYRISGFFYQHTEDLYYAKFLLIDKEETPK